MERTREQLMAKAPSITLVQHVCTERLLLSLKEESYLLRANSCKRRGHQWYL